MRCQKYYKQYKQQVVQIATVMLFFMIVSCGTAPMKVLYTLENTHETNTKDDPKQTVCSIALGLNPVDVLSPYDITKIIFRPDPLEVRFYTQSQWVSHPEEMFAKLITARIEDERLFSTVDASVNVTGPHLSLLVKVHAVEELDRDKEWFGRLSMSVFLTDEMEGQLLWSHRFDAQEKTPKDEVRSVIEVLNKLYNREMDKVVKSLREFLSNGGCTFSRSANHIKKIDNYEKDSETYDGSSNDESSEN